MSHEVVLLAQESTLEFQQQLTQLLLEKDFRDGSKAGWDDERHAAPGAGGQIRRLQRRPTEALRTAQRNGLLGDTTDYYTRVVNLLTPLGSDSARAAAIAADPSLRAELTQMAEDSLTWGSGAARAALNQYSGTHYREWIVDEEPLPDGARHNGPAPTAKLTKPTGYLLLAPNPSSGAVRVGYGLPEAAHDVLLRVYDEWGQPAGEYRLTAEALADGVTLRLRAGIYQCQLVADGMVVAKDRLLITH